jgi:hypothetical protein
MTIELTEKEVLRDLLTPSEYQAFAMRVYKDLRSSKEYENNDPICFAIQTYQINDSCWLHIEASLKKARFNEFGVDDFGFVRFVLSDENLIDFTLDRYNEAKRLIDSDKPN